MVIFHFNVNFQLNNWAWVKAKFVSAGDDIPKHLTDQQHYRKEEMTQKCDLLH